MVKEKASAKPAVKKKSISIALNHYTFSNPSLLQQALTHKSFGQNNNERLEYLGDAILGYVIADRLYHQFPEANEGQLSRLRSTLVKNDTLAKIAKQLNLADMLILGPGELKSGGWRRASILANTLEALIGAIYLDSDMKHCRYYILTIYEDYLSRLDLDDVKKDAKTELKEYLQACQASKPIYQLISKSGKPHLPEFRISCLIEKLSRDFVADGPSKKLAEQAAASMALAALHAEDNKQS